MAEPRRSAAALAYQPGETAPRLVAHGHGHVADAILEAAREAGIPVRDDAALVEALNALELGAHVPAELYRAVAEALVWAYRIATDARAAGRR